MITYKKLANTNYDVFLSVCIWLYHAIQDLEYEKEKDPQDFKRLCLDYSLKLYKRSFNTAKKYLKGVDYYHLGYMTLNCDDVEISQKRHDFLCDKFGC